MEINNIAHKIEEKERTSDIKLSEKVPFRKMMLSERVRRGLAQAGFVYPTVLQSNAIPLGRAGIDMLIQSKSGTGKTLIFCITILDSYDYSIRAPQSLVLVPTREVAVQIESVLNQVGKYLPDFSAVSVIGGTDIHVDRKRLQSARAIVGTPGRVMHLIRSSILNTEFVKLLIIDEADKFLEASFRRTFEEINSALVNKKQTIASSATLSMGLDSKLAKYMKNPLLLSAEKRAAILVGIKQFVHKIPEEKTNIVEMTSKVSALMRIFSKVSFKQCIVFVNSQSRAESYCSFLEKDGWPSDFITGAQDQATRLEKFKRFREFKTRILISTDLMSRGIDSENLNLVINLEVPDDGATYLHRIGRAGRFGTYGLAISFIASNKDLNKFKNILSSIGPAMIVFKYPEKSAFDLWNFSNLEAEEKEFGLFNLSDSDTNKENDPSDHNKFKAASKQEKDCNNESKVDKKPLSESINAKLTFTVSNSSQKIPSNSAVTLDDASSLTADSDTKQIEKPVKVNNIVDLCKSCDSQISQIQSKELKISPIDLVLDSDSRASLIKYDLFEDYNKVATSSESLTTVTDQKCPPNTLEYSPGRILRQELSTSLTSEIETISSQEIFKNEKRIYEEIDGYEVVLDKVHRKSNHCNIPGPSSSSAMDQSRLNIANSPSINRVNFSDVHVAKLSTDSETESSIKLSPRKVAQRNETYSDDSDYNDNLESDISGSESVPSSGFGEKIPTEASSGIVTSTEYSDSESGSDCTYYSTSTSTEESYVRSEEESTESCASEDSGWEGRNVGALIQARANNGDSRYKYAHDRWNNIYWQQINQIQDYVNISKYMRRESLKTFQ